MSGKYFSWRLNSSLWALSRTFCLEVKMRSSGFQASTKRSHPRQPGSAFLIARHCTRWLEANILSESLEVFGSVVYLDLLVIVGMLAEPVVWLFSGDWGRLPLVAAADDLDAATLGPRASRRRFPERGGALCRSRPI